MFGLLKLWLQSWQSVQTEALAAAQLVGNAGTSIGSKAFAFINSVASSSTMGIAMLSVTLTTVVSTASVVYDVVLDPGSPLQVQEVMFDSGMGQSEDEDTVFIQDLMQVVHDPSAEHMEFIPWIPDEQWMLDSGLWTEDEILSILENLGLTPDFGSDNISSLLNDDDTPPPVETLTTTPQPDPNDTVILRPITNPPPVITLTPPTVTIERQPAAALDVNEGSIAGGLIIDAERTGIATLTYQWYQSYTGSNTDGTAIPGATGHVFFIPTNLTEGTYYYYAVVTATSNTGTASITSNISVVTIHPPVAPLHNLTVIGGGTGATLSGNRAEGSLVELHPGRRFGYGFTGFTVTSGGVTLIDYPTAPGFTDLPTHLFTMPANDVTVTATWVEIIPTITITELTVSEYSQVGSGALMAVKASVNTGEALFYQWYFNTTDSNIGGTAISGATGDLAIVGPYTEPGLLYYYVEISSPGSPTVTSDAALITVRSSHTITIVDGAAGAYSVNSDTWDWSAESHANGTPITIYPGIKPGYMFKGWDAEPDIDITVLNSTTGVSEFTMPTSDVTVTAIWEELPPDRYTVTVVSEGADYADAYSTATGDPLDPTTWDRGPFLQNDDIMIEAGTRPGHIFNGWTITSGNVTLTFPNDWSTNAFTMPAGDVVITANWLKLYNVTVNSEFTLVADGWGLYAPGETVRVVSGFHLLGYTFDKWTSPDIPESDITREFDDTALGFHIASFTMPAHDVTITANWVEEDAPPEQFEVTVVSDGAIIDTIVASPGDEVTIFPGERTGFTFVDWTASPDIPSGITLFDFSFLGFPLFATFTMPENDVTVTAIWEEDVSPEQFEVTVVSAGATDATPSGSHVPGSTVEINAGTRGDWTFNGWTATRLEDPFGIGWFVPMPFDPAEMNIGNPNSAITTFTMPDYDITVTANWVWLGQLFTVEVISDGAGSLAINMDTANFGPFTPDETITIIAGDNPGHIFTGWTVTSGNVTLDDPSNEFTTFTMPTGDVVVTANWEVDTAVKYSVTVNAGGAHIFEGGGLYEPGDTVTIFINTNTGFIFNGWTSSDIPTGIIEGAPYWGLPTLPPSAIFIMPDNDVTITANWDPPITGASIQLSLELPNGEPPIGDATEPPEPETGEPPESEPPPEEE